MRRDAKKKKKKEEEEEKKKGKEVDKHERRRKLKIVSELFNKVYALWFSRFCRFLGMWYSQFDDER